MNKNSLAISKTRKNSSRSEANLSSSITQLSLETLKAIASLSHDNVILERASANLAEAVNRASLTVKEKKNSFEAVQTNERYKTELCRKFMENSSCPYGRKCQFSHGYHELKPVTRHPRYRTELCREFFNTGLCTYGTRCNFIHHCQDTSNSQQTSDEEKADSKITNYFGVSTGLRSYSDLLQCVDTSDRPYTPNNDSGFGGSTPSYTSTPLSREDGIEFTRVSDRSESPNDLYAIPEEAMKE